MKVKLRIDGQDDRRTVAGILADNGYETNIEKKVESFENEYYVIVEVKKK